MSVTATAPAPAPACPPPAGDLTVAQLDAHLCFWFVDELKPHLARLMRSNIVPMHVLALLTAQAAVRVYAGGEGTVSMADLDKRLYCALAECRGLMVEAALQAVRLYVAWRVKLKAEVGRGADAACGRGGVGMAGQLTNGYRAAAREAKDQSAGGCCHRSCPCRRQHAACCCATTAIPLWLLLPLNQSLLPLLCPPSPLAL